MTTNLYYKGVCIKVDAYLEEKEVVSEDGVDHVVKVFGRAIGIEDLI